MVVDFCAIINLWGWGLALAFILEVLGYTVQPQLKIPGHITGVLSLLAALNALLSFCPV